MRPLGIYLIGISMYILNMIHFLTILANFGVFSLMVTDGRTYGQTDPHIEMRGRIQKSLQETRLYEPILKISTTCDYIVTTSFKI